MARTSIPGPSLWQDSVGSGWLTARRCGSKSGIPHDPSLPPATPKSPPGARRTSGSQISHQSGLPLVQPGKGSCALSWSSTSSFWFYIHHSKPLEYQDFPPGNQYSHHALTSPAPGVMYRSTLNSEEVDHAYRESEPGTKLVAHYKKETYHALV